MKELLYIQGCIYIYMTKRMEKKAWGQLHKNATSYIEQILEAMSHKPAAVRPPTSQL